jgi:hypothetical protein
VLFLQNITGFTVGRAHEEAGMIKHEAKLIEALSNAPVARLTVLCGASYGAGNYGMCGRAFKPSFLFSWPNAKNAVMGGEQAAMTMRQVTEAAGRRGGEAVDEEALARESREIVDNFNTRSSAIYTSSLLLDDGVINPRDTRDVLAIVLETVSHAQLRSVTPIQFGVARFQAALCSTHKQGDKHEDQQATSHWIPGRPRGQLAHPVPGAGLADQAGALRGRGGRWRLRVRHLDALLRRTNCGTLGPVCCGGEPTWCRRQSRRRVRRAVHARCPHLSGHGKQHACG